MGARWHTFRHSLLPFGPSPTLRHPLTHSEPPAFVVRLLPPLLPRLLPLGATQAEATGHLVRARVRVTGLGSQGWGHGARVPVRAQVRVRAGVVKGERPPRAPGRFRLGSG